jgi:hypothetical protein
VDYTPSVLSFNVLFNKNSPMRYIEGPFGVYCTQQSKWLDGRPADWDSHEKRSVLPEDLVHLIAHGLLPSNDYEALKEKGLIDGTAQKVYESMEKLREFILQQEEEERRRPVMGYNYMNFDDAGSEDLDE